MDKAHSQSRETNNGKLEKRNRPPISCEPCRTRKLKCNRELPCDTCIRRNKHASCEYASNANRGKPKRSTTSNRLENLENMVLQFMQNSTSGNGPEQKTSQRSNHVKSSSDQSTTETPSFTSGTFHVDNDGEQVNYVDSSHWLSILHDIKEVREELSLTNAQTRTKLSSEEINPVPEMEMDMAFGQLAPITLHAILQSLPPRPVCDSLVSYYFNFPYIVLPILHPVAFQNEYERFWNNPSKSSMLWIGLLFSILGIATTLRTMTNTSNESGGSTLSPSVCRLRTQQCLVLGKYATSKAYGLETLFLHLLGGLIGLADAPTNLWFLMGIIIRLAIRMGYHRDPRNYSSITPFEGEMRRRLWHCIFQLDALMSFQLGLPSMIPTDCSDTEPPRNLQFSDFHPDTTVLPPSRPVSDLTPVLYTIVKGSVMRVFKKITAHAQSLSPPSLETTIMLDIEMREAYDSIPSDWKMMPMSRSFTDSTATIMKRCSIEVLYLKSIIVLHRRFLNVDSMNVKYASQRRACLDAAMALLARQADLHQACQPGGQLSSDQWMVSSLLVYDFLLAAMVVCLKLSVQRRIAANVRDAESTNHFNALQTSYAIWTSRTSVSKEAATAAQVLGLMIRTVQDDNVNNLSSSSLAEEDYSTFAYAEPVLEMIDGPENIDWLLLDQYFQDTSGYFVSNYSGAQGNDGSLDIAPDWIN